MKIDSDGLHLNSQQSYPTYVTKDMIIGRPVVDDAGNVIGKLVSAKKVSTFKDASGQKLNMWSVESVTWDTKLINVFKKLMPKEDKKRKSTAQKKTKPKQTVKKKAAKKPIKKKANKKVTVFKTGLKKKWQ